MFISNMTFALFIIFIFYRSMIKLIEYLRKFRANSGDANSIEICTIPSAHAFALCLLSRILSGNYIREHFRTAQTTEMKVLITCYNFFFIVILHIMNL